jgi:hypothetical protein
LQFELFWQSGSSANNVFSIGVNHTGVSGRLRFDKRVFKESNQIEKQKKTVEKIHGFFT